LGVFVISKTFSKVHVLANMEEKPEIRVFCKVLSHRHI